MDGTSLSGAWLTEMLKQPQFQPMRIERQVVIVYAATKGYLDRLEVSHIVNTCWHARRKYEEMVVWSAVTDLTRQSVM
jgi:F0F1-type ATP synthase alpha subunit